MHHIFITENQINISDNEVLILKESDSYNFNHLVKSLRVETEEKILCSVEDFKSSFDYLCSIKEIDKERVILKIEEEKKPNELPKKINLYQGICKQDKLEYIIEKAVELGVYTITPVSTVYTVAKIDEEKKNKKLERLNKIAKSAAEQSKRHIIPKVNEPAKFNDIINKLDKNDVNIIFYENANDFSKTKEVIKDIKHKENVNINIFIGSEGGFSEKEISIAKENNFYILSLGNFILRTETASVVALSIIMYEIES